VPGSRSGQKTSFSRIVSQTRPEQTSKTKFSIRPWGNPRQTRDNQKVAPVIFCFKNIKRYFSTGVEMAERTARTALSPENRVVVQLNALGCSQKSFAAIANLPYSTFAAVMAGTRDFTTSEADHAQQVIGELFDLQSEISRVRGVIVPLDWTKTDQIGTAITIRRLAQIAADEFADHRFDRDAQRATAIVGEGQ
jgi:predicted transcriptional regulator